VLHAPGECEYCDAHPEWQELREAWGIAYTGHSYEIMHEKDWEGKDRERILVPCPAELERPLEVINEWSRNKPRLKK
jgi:hypothetical protein